MKFVIMEIGSVLEKSCPSRGTWIEMALIRALLS